ncbi:hypothetical protein PDENDC454_14572 [Paenibacillus dendritiformis C454]|uniref:Uncharacterized protein n=1 Tax=Paenibacillus dendritiformis C454 TaxID=1131935 RepID=H3SHA3_9BACL|nr:hypothetical protein PDENDC454_14572 [Paenibacillus dendritiformis C454]
MSMMTVTYVQQMRYCITKLRTVMVIKCIARTRQSAELVRSRPNGQRVRMQQSVLVDMFGLNAESGEEAEQLRHTEENKRIYAHWKETIDRVLLMQRRSMVCGGRPYEG